MTKVTIKPSVFFSHASADGAAIAALKKRFLQITGGSIDVFVSSDGQSIRFGRNWHSEIEEALGRCKIMFVFVSPRSAASGWIFFEAGHANGRGIQVVPVAFLGADLNALPGPLALLQGFNVKDAAGLDNIVAIVNQVFAHSHAGKFTDEDFAEFGGGAADAGASFCAPYTNLIDTIRVEIDLTNAPFAVVSDWSDVPSAEKVRQAQAAEQSVVERARQLVTEYLRSRDVVFLEEAERGTVHAQGLSVEPGRGRTVNINIDAASARQLIPLAEGIARVLQPSGILDLFVWFNRAVDAEHTSHRVTGRLSAVGVTIDASVAPHPGSNVPPLFWRGVGFRLGFGFGGGDERPPAFLSTTASHTFDVDWLDSLLQLLFERGILFPR